MRRDHGRVRARSPAARQGLEDRLRSATNPNSVSDTTCRHTLPRRRPRVMQRQGGRSSSCRTRRPPRSSGGLGLVPIMPPTAVTLPTTSSRTRSVRGLRTATTPEPRVGPRRHDGLAATPPVHTASDHQSEAGDGHRPVSTGDRFPCSDRAPIDPRSPSSSGHRAPCQRHEIPANRPNRGSNLRNRFHRRLVVGVCRRPWSAASTRAARRASSGRRGRWRSCTSC